MEETHKPENNVMLKLAAAIVDKRNLVFLIVVIGVIFSAFSRNWVQVENDLAKYLPPDSETRLGLDVMEEQFITFGTAEVMVPNVTWAEAQKLRSRIETLEGVQGVAFDGSDEHYANVSALYSVTFGYDQSDGRCLEALDRVEAALSGYDLYISTELGDQQSEIIASEVSRIMVYVAIIVVAVLILTSQTYAEVPVLILTFVTAMILNLGSNFLLGKISFVSNSVTSILQLALSLDYAVILSNRFKEERRTAPIREAAVVALSKAIPEIGASSLTTVGGLVAMLFMQFRIGPDMGVNLIKAIAFALLSVFTVMPGLLVLFGPLMDRTKHRSFIPKIPFVGKFDYATRFVIPPLFVVLVLFALHFSDDCPYVYGYDKLATPRLNEAQIAENMIKDNFNSSNLVALVIPTGDYEKERAILDDLDRRPEVRGTMGICNIEAMDGYMLADKLTPRQFAELADLDYELAQAVYAAYAVRNEEYGQIVGGISAYGVPLIDIFLFVCDQMDKGYVTLDDGAAATLRDAQTRMENGLLQLQGTEYDRCLVYLNLPEDGDETYAFLDTIHSVADQRYPDGNVYVVGNSSTAYEFQKSFGRDNSVVSIVSILIVLVVLLFTFKSAGMPLLLILVIQGSIWINFSFPTLTAKPIFFMSYLVVSSIQMGANIDYAIVIASRYQDLKPEMHHRDAIVETLNFAFPTIITSGMILAVSGILIGRMTSEACIVGIGESLGRGTIISIVLVMFILPQILLLGGAIVDKTSFSVAAPVRRHSASGRVLLDGQVHGEIHGVVTAMVRGVVEGSVNVNLISGTVMEENGSEAD